MMAMAAAAQWAVWLILLGVCLLTAALMAGMETGIYVLNKLRLDLRSEAGFASAKMLRGMLSRPRWLLAVLLVGNNIGVYGVTFAISAMFVLSGRREHAELYALAVATPLLFVLGESAPKNVFQRLAETLTYRLVGMLASAGTLLSATGLVPLVRGFSWLMLKVLHIGELPRQPVGREGLAAIVAESHASGALTHMQSIMADRVMNISDVRLGDVMIPMRLVDSAPAGVDVEHLRVLAAWQNHSRLPLLNEAGKVTGIVEVIDILACRSPLLPAEKVREPLVLPSQLGVTEALYRMQRAHAAMGVVHDEAGGHIGIVTIKDLVEEIVGELDAW